MAALTEASAAATADTGKIARHLDFIFQPQAELAAQTTADMTRILANRKRAQAPKTRRQIRTGGPLSVRDANVLIKSRDIAEAEKEKRRWARMLRKRAMKCCAMSKLRPRKTRKGKQSVDGRLDQTENHFIV